MRSDGAAGVSFRIGVPAFSFCRCHDGAGPGVDGKLPIELTSYKLSPATIIPLALELEPLGPGDNIVVDSREPSTSSIGFEDGGTVVEQVTLPPGSERTFVVAVAIDITEAQLVPGAHRVIVEISIAGEQLRLPAGSTSIPFL